MDEYNLFPKSLALSIDSPYCNQLDIESFAQMMNSPTCCYKFYWLEAIVRLITENKMEATYDEIIDEMISNAWFTVLEYHIHLSGMVLGEFRDALEQIIVCLSKESLLLSNASKVEIKNVIKRYNNVIKDYKITLTKYVPYRALSGFYHRFVEGGGAKINWNSVGKIVEYTNDVNKHVLLPYTFDDNKLLERKVKFNSVWMQYIQDNSVAILGWIQHEKSKWLQLNNPEVPSIVYKLTPFNTSIRKLEQVRKLWELVMEQETIFDIYANTPIDKQKYEIDHFIPWSFVMNDELWNLSPLISSLNSSKNNRLPPWMFFKRFASNQFLMYRLICENSCIRKQFEKCYSNNLHSIWAVQELFALGNSEERFTNILKKNLQPLYDSARRQGYEVWNFKETPCARQ